MLIDIMLFKIRQTENSTENSVHLRETTHFQS